MVLEAAIGLIFVYLLFSLICSALSEIVAWFLNLRASTLRDGIETLLKDDACKSLVQQNARLKAMFDKGVALQNQAQNVTSTLYAHPLIQGMTHGNRYPSYIPKHIFAAAFLDVLRNLAGREEGPRDGPQKDAMQKLRDAIAKLPPESEIRQQLEAVLDDTVTNVREARARVEKWFDDSMERVSGWYKRRAQIIVLAVAATVVGIGNADSVMIVRSLAHDSALRAGVVAAAEQYVQANAQLPPGNLHVTDSVKQLREVRDQLNDLRLPIGWAGPDAMLGGMPDPRRIPGWDVMGWMAKLVGLLFTVFAVSMGAPFWFDILNKVVNARITGGQPPETEAKKDKEKKKEQQT
ncbi:hypothetical protein [Hyalangium gracile]|uniref:hypothetical protein n=1 Tax=Hyalangium gracile TaxID=394092 RepID=UPI001CCBF2E0|nr:hypothetical protein [Hyalangium gracile]